MALDTATALTQIEVALRGVLRDALAKPLAVANQAAIKALASNARRHGEQFYATAEAVRWEFDRFSTATAPAAVLVPDDAPTAGRYLLRAGAGSTGYCRAVDLFEGQSTAEAILERFGGSKPAIVIVYDGAPNNPISTTPGALYDYRPVFLLWLLSSNLRGQHQTAIGSAVAAEATDDPGVNRMLGDCKALLAGSTLGVLAGVKYVEIGDERRVFTSLADRTMIYQLRVEVRATCHNPDTDLVTPDDPGGFYVQRQLADIASDGTVTLTDYGPVDQIPQP